MAKYRKNSVVLDFNVMPVRPDIGSVSKFIDRALKLDMKRTRNLQFNNSRNHVIIELETPEEASDLAALNLKHKMGYSGQRYAIPIFVEDDAIQVRVADLPPHMPNELIVAQLETYGEVKSIRNEVWREYFPGVPNGVRVVRMQVMKPIPSFLVFEQELGFITYAQQQKTCRHCGKPIHLNQKCNEANTTTTTTTATTTTSTTTQITVPPPQPTAPKTTETTETTKTTTKRKINTKPMDISSDEDNAVKEQNEAGSTKMTFNFEHLHRCTLYTVCMSVV